MTQESTETPEVLCKRFWAQFVENTRPKVCELDKIKNGRPVFVEKGAYGRRFADITKCGEIVATVLAGVADKVREVDEKGGCVEVLLEKRDKAINKAIFHHLKKDEKIIERELGFPLIWMEFPNKKRSRITINNTFNPRCTKDWEEHNKWFKEKIEAFERVFTHRLKNIEF